MAQDIPKYVPVLASDLGNYPAGGDDWAGAPKRVELSAGEQLGGLVPGEPVDAQTLNWILGVLGEHAAASADTPSFQWTPYPKYTSADIVASTDPNENRVDERRLIFSAGDRLLVHTPGGGTGVAFHTGIVPGHGLGFGSHDADTSPFYASADSGATASAIILARRDSNRIVVCDPADGDVFFTDDWGANWSAGGSASTAINCGGFYGGARHFVKFVGPTTWSVYSSSTLSGSWANTDVTIPSASNQELRRFIEGGPAGVFLPQETPSAAQFLVNAGAGWIAQPVATIGAARTGWRGDWNQRIGRYLATNLNGECYMSSDGLAWTLVFSLGDSIYDVAAHGRGFVLSCGAEDFSGPATFPYLTYLAYDRTQTLVARRLPVVTPGQFYSRFHLIRHRGRVVAARALQSTSEWLEYWVSGVHHADLINLTGL